MRMIVPASSLALLLLLAPALASAQRGGRQADPLPAPASAACSIGADVVQVSWEEVAGAGKYAVSFECEDPTGTMEMDVDHEPEERLTDLFADVPVDTFPLEVILSGEGAWTCLAKVKGLNPPGRRQNHAQAVALCE